MSNYIKVREFSAFEAKSLFSALPSPKTKARDRSSAAMVISSCAPGMRRSNVSARSDEAHRQPSLRKHGPPVYAAAWLSDGQHVAQYPGGLGVHSYCRGAHVSALRLLIRTLSERRIRLHHGWIKAGQTSRSTYTPRTGACGMTPSALPISRPAS